MSQYDAAGAPFVPGLGARIHVLGRDEVGEIVDSGKQFGRIYCVGVYFPNTGEVVYYSRERVSPAK